MRAVWSLFPKLYRDFSAGQLADLVQSVGLDTTNVVIRKGYPVDEEFVATDLSRFMNEATQAGLTITCASTTFSADVLASDQSPMAPMAGCGIKEFRMGWFPKATGDVHEALKAAKADMDRVAEAAQKHRIRAIYQIHHNTLITSPSAAYNLVRGLPSQWIGVELDPGNQSFQGFEPWDFSVGLLGDYCAWLAVKDTVTWQEKTLATDPDKGWRRTFAPISEGVTNWHRVMEALKVNQFDGTLVFMPFYEEDNGDARDAKLKAEVAYLRSVVSAVGGF